MQPRPSDWKRVKLGDVAASEPNSFVDGPFGSNLKTDEYSDEGVRLIQLQNIGEGLWMDDNRKFIPPRKFQELIRHAAYPGDIAIAKMADPVARACLIPPVAEQFVVVADCIRLTPDRTQYDPQYLVYAINHRDVRLQAEQKSTGTTRQRINLSKLKTLEVWAPSLPEQRRIAEILDAADEAIRQTERVVAKLKAVKAGLLHDLLTRGLDEHGHLRDPQAHPEQFKDSPLGRIPKGWEVHRLGDLARVRRGASPRPIDSPEWFSDEGPGWVRIGDVTRADNRLLETEQHLSPAGVRKSVPVHPGQVIMSICATIGEPIILGVEACIHDGFVVFDQHEHYLTPEFLVHYLRLRQNAFRSRGQTGTQANLNTGIVKSHFLAVPPLSEQRQITASLDAHDARIRAEEATLAKLRQVKRGLMDDLLTGKVRVV